MPSLKPNIYLGVLRAENGVSLKEDCYQYYLLQNEHNEVIPQKPVRKLPKENKIVYIRTRNWIHNL